MEDKWVAFRKEIYPDKPPCVRQKITYENPGHPGWKILSVKHAAPHATGSGSWTWTNYITISPNAQMNRFHRMMDAKAFVQQQSQ